MTKPPNHAFRLKLAKQKAEAFLRDEGITILPIDPFEIAAGRDITVEPKPDSAEGVSGMLLRHGDSFGILYATNFHNEGFERFSIAHELGHFFLEGHIDHVLPKGGVHQSCSGFISSDPYELEADQFAAGLLMPSSLFKPLLNREDPGLEIIESLSTLCKTSLTATAIRFTELTGDATAVIVSTGQQIDFCLFSDSMKSLPQLTWLKKGAQIPQNSATAKFNCNFLNVTNCDRSESEIDIMDWLGGIRSIPAKEQVIGLGKYGRTLTVLTCPTVQDGSYQEDEGDDEESLTESWTPRFRK